MIEQLKIKNFMAFSDELTVNFSPKINVIIGENGTGKTQLLKLVFAPIGGFSSGEVDPTQKSDVVTPYTKRLVDLFMPLEKKLGKLHHTGATEHAKISCIFQNGIEQTTSFFNNSAKVSLRLADRSMSERKAAVFIPTKEVLSGMQGFVSLYDKYSLSYDITYRIMSAILDLPPLREEILHTKAKWAMEEIEKICGGKFIFYGGGNVTFKTAKDVEYSTNAMGEGFRKVGTLSRLLEVGAIQPGVSGPLLWDEPEANLNPKLMKALVEILLELSRNGQQIILTTHDYVLLKWFDLLMDKGKGDHVRYHTLYRNENNVVQIKSTDDYKAIANNPISEAFTDLTVAHAQARLQGV